MVSVVLKMVKSTANKASLPPLAELAPAPVRRGIRLTTADSPRFAVTGDALWRAWLDLAAHMPRTRLIAQNEGERRSFHIQRSRLFRFPDLVRAEIIDLESGQSTIAIDSRARYGYYDFGVNRQRVEAWLAELVKALRNRD
jgi:uncharacterized protein (DUF1499 family)